MIEYGKRKKKGIQLLKKGKITGRNKEGKEGLKK